MKIEQTKLSGVVVITPDRFSDERGFFSESWSKSRLRDAGIDIDFVQDNHSLSLEVGTLRGLHFQAPPYAQAKLVRCGRGRLFDVAVDIRRGSPTFGQWTGAELSFDNGKQLFIPQGFLHGFVTRDPETEVIYKCSAPYHPASDGAVRYDSAGIDWGLTSDPILSAKDADAPALANFETPFTYEA